MKITIEERDECIIVYDPVPIRWFERFAGMIEGAVVATDLARMMEASFAFGRPDDVDALIAKLKPEAEARVAQQTAGQGLSENAQRWLASGERGASSNTIFTRMTGYDAMRGFGQDHPWDPADFRRCRLLLEWCPLFAERLPEMASVSKAWAGLVQNWDAICLTMDAENPDWRTGRGSYPRTYDLIKQAIDRK